LHNKPKAAVRAGACMLTGPREEEEISAYIIAIQRIEKDLLLFFEEVCTDCHNVASYFVLVKIS
jgi:hypothetical protein